MADHKAFLEPLTKFLGVSKYGLHDAGALGLPEEHKLDHVERGKFLKKIAASVIAKFGSTFPEEAREYANNLLEGYGKRALTETEIAEYAKSGSGEPDDIPPSSDTLARLEKHDLGKISGESPVISKSKEEVGEDGLSSLLDTPSRPPELTPPTPTRPIPGSGEATTTVRPPSTVDPPVPEPAKSRSEAASTSEVDSKLLDVVEKIEGKIEPSKETPGKPDTPDSPTVVVEVDAKTGKTEVTVDSEEATRVIEKATPTEEAPTRISDIFPTPESAKSLDDIAAEFLLSPASDERTPESAFVGKPERPYGVATPEDRAERLKEAYEHDVALYRLAASEGMFEPSFHEADYRRELAAKKKAEEEAEARTREAAVEAGRPDTTLLPTPEEEVPAPPAPTTPTPTEVFPLPEEEPTEVFPSGYPGRSRRGPPRPPSGGPPAFEEEIRPLMPVVTDWAEELHPPDGGDPFFWSGKDPKRREGGMPWALALPVPDEPTEKRAPLEELMHRLKRGGDKAATAADVEVYKARRRYVETDAELHKAPIRVEKAEERLAEEERKLAYDIASGASKKELDARHTEVEKRRARVEKEKGREAKAGEDFASAKERLDKAYRARDTAELRGHIGAAKEMAGELGGKAGGALGEALGIAQLGMRAAAGDPIAIAQLAMKAKEIAIDRPIDNAKKAVGSLWEAAQVGSGASTLSHLMDTVGYSADMLSVAPGSEVVTYLASLGKEVLDVTEKIKKWTDGLHASNMQFAEFSASMAKVEAEMEVRRIQLSKEMGDRTAGTAQTLAEKKSEADSKWLPVDAAFGNLKNIAGAFGEELRGALGETIAKALGLEGTSTAEGFDMPKWIEDVTFAHWDDTTYARPDRFPPPGGRPRPGGL